MKLRNFSKRLYTSILLLFLIFLIFKSNLFFTYTLIILGIFSLMEFTNMTKKFIKNKKKLHLANFIFLFYIISIFFIFFILNNYFQTKVLVFSLLFCCVASDIGGFVFGNLFKGPKLSKISPNKTISGALGSLILSAIVLVVIFNFLSINFSMIIIIIAIITS